MNFVSHKGRKAVSRDFDVLAKQYVAIPATAVPAETFLNCGVSA